MESRHVCYRTHFIWFYVQPRVKGPQVIRIYECKSFYFSNWGVSPRKASTAGAVRGMHIWKYSNNISVNQFHNSWTLPTNYGPIKRVRVWKKTKDIMRKISLGKVIFNHLMERCLSPHIKPFKGQHVSKWITLRALKCILWSWVTLRTGAKLWLRWLNKQLPGFNS